ncbi:hypothetical protein [Mesorhizobium sp. B2-6-5]|uniref:hypothetical protein n=1 Tax=Mesorhizobium sp. B2-6-5 TaxID=2589912 RepID=UPI00112CC927|nr:hypothetical protein [Mesorhizobium sp. B2-6-5]TPJ34265.1 hypothetical protein FJ432_30035 [Mesorhizobium sp. B2-6-5]
MKKDRSSSPFASLAALHAELAAIDQEMRKAGVRVHARPMRGWTTLSFRNGLGLQRPSPNRDPQPNDLSWDALTEHIRKWFERRYGKRANIVYAPSAGVIDIDGDLFRMWAPMIFGQVNFEINPERLEFKYRPLVRNRIPKDNLLKSLDGLTPSYAESIPTTLYKTIGDQAGQIMVTYNEMLAHLGTVLVAEASVDIDAGVSALLGRISPGHAKWCFHQAAEKSIKALLQHEGVQDATLFKAGHDLAKLVALSPTLTASNRVTAAMIDAITCSPKARYGQIQTSIGEALGSYQNALIFILGALQLIVPVTRRFGGIAIYTGSFPAGEFDAALDGFN